jgi:hypothetical protein
MSSNVSVHSWPVEALHKAFLGLVDAIVPGEQFAMSLRQSYRNESSWEEEYYSAGFELSFDLAPDQTIFDKTIVGE